MKYGFTKEQYEYFKEQLIGPLKKLNAQLYIFGSRATGEHRKFSDVDVLVSPKNELIENCVTRIREEFENGNFPFKLDLLFEEDLADSFRNSVMSQKLPIES